VGHGQALRAARVYLAGEAFQGTECFAPAAELARGMFLAPMRKGAPRTVMLAETG
jgi:hypothetical protein